MKRKSKIGKQEFVQIVQNYYRHNNKILSTVELLDRSYTAADSLSWCLRSPFPSRFINHAFYSRSMEQLNYCHFLISDTSRLLQQQSKHNSTIQIYRGMRLSRKIIEKLANNIGRLICTSWFFVCTKSRATAITSALSPKHRSDLIPVLFKIYCDSTSTYLELSKNTSSPLTVCDLCTAFRILYVSQDQMVIVKIKMANDDGQRLAHEYQERHINLPTVSLLDQLVDPSKSRNRQQLQNKGKP